MANKNWEKALRDKLSQPRTDYDERTWDQLSEKLDESEGLNEPTEAEKLMKSRLNNYRSRYEDRHWEQLQAELENIESRTTQLWIIKLGELLLVLFLIASFLHIHNFYSPSAIHRDYTPKPRHEYAHHIKPQVSIPTPLQINTKPVADAIRSNMETRLKTLQTTVFNVPEVASLSEHRDAPNTMIEKIATTQDVMNHAIEPLPSLPIGGIVSTTQTVEPVAMPQWVATPKSHDISGAYWVVAYSRDVNGVNTSIDFEHLKGQLDRDIASNSFELGYAVQKGIVQGYIGLNYGRKGHVPSRNADKLYSSLGGNSHRITEINRIDFDQLSIPITLSLHALNGSRSNVYMRGGVSINTILNYDFHETTTDIIPNAQARIAGLYLDKNSTGGYPRGVLEEGGGMRDNIYYSGIIAFGFQSLVGQRFMLFIEPQYEFNLSSGPNNFIQRAPSANIQVGMKLKI